jgi:hypothetical protein
VVKILCHAALLCPRASTTSKKHFNEGPDHHAAGSESRRETNTHVRRSSPTHATFSKHLLLLLHAMYLLTSVYCIGALAGNTSPPPPHLLSRIEYGTTAVSTLQTFSDEKASLIGRVYKKYLETAIKRNQLLPQKPTIAFPSPTVSTHATVKLPKFRNLDFLKG